jgi:sRNA-binding protein
MNPEPDPAADSEAPNDAPAAAGPAAPMQTAMDAAPAVAGDGSSGDAPHAMLDPLHDAPSTGSNPAVPELSLAATGARLAELFPALFATAGASGAPGPAKPIKLRIHADIQARAPGVFTKRMLGIFFSRYTTSNAYLKALATAPHRFDLDGAAAGEIAAEHRQAAGDELTRRHALAAQRRAAQRPLPRRDVPADDGETPIDARRESRPERRPGPRPDARQDTPHAARAPQRSRDGEQRAEQRIDASRSSQSARPPRHASRPQRPERAPQPSRAEAPTAAPVDPAQRERALLLRSFEASTLSKANFCALKRMTEAQLDALLAQARAERA